MWEKERAVGSSEITVIAIYGFLRHPMFCKVMYKNGKNNVGLITQSICNFEKLQK